MNIQVARRHVKGSPSRTVVMVNFRCQLDRATEHPDIRSDVTLGVSVSVFLSEVNICIHRASKADRAPSGGWASSDQLKPEQNKKLTLLPEVRVTSCLTAGHWSSLPFRRSFINICWPTNTYYVFCVWLAQFCSSASLSAGCTLPGSPATGRGHRTGSCP